MQLWKKTKLLNLITIKHGFAFKGEFFTSEGQLMVLTPGNFHEQGGFRVREGKEKFYCGQFPKEYILNQNDLIVAMTEQGEGLLGSTAIIPENNKYLHNQRLGLISANEKIINKKFIYYLFNSQMVRRQIRNSSSGAKVRHTSPERIYKVDILLPPLETQKKIAAILSAYDDLIETNKQRIALLEKMAEEIYREWFVRFRFPGWQNTEFEKGIPKGWETTRLDTFCEFVKGKNPKVLDNEQKEDLCVYINVDSLTGGNLTYSRKQKNSVMCNVGDVLMLMDGSRSGLVFRADKSGILGSTFSLLRTKQNLKNYLYEYLKAMQKEIIFNNTGSAIPHANKEFLKKMILSLPKDEELLEKFNKVYGCQYKQIETLRLANLNLNQTKSALLPRLISGKLSVENLDIEFPPSLQ